MKKILMSMIALLCSLSFADPIGTQVASNAVAIQSNNKIVSAGYATACEHEQLMIARYNTDGSVDGTFNGTGSATTVFGSNAEASAVVIQPSDQKIVIAGSSDNSIALARYLTSGALDTNFGSGGLVNFVLGSSQVADAIALQSGKILIAGATFLSSTEQFLVARFNSTGVIDSTFGASSGYTTTPIGDGATANAMTTQISSGKIILAGTAVISGQPEFAIARYSTSGALDLTFGSSGTTTTPIGTSATGHAVAVDSSNRIYVAGSSINSGSTFITLARYTAGGILDTSFNSGGSQPGVVTLNIPSADPDIAYGVAIQSDGKIVVAGQSGSQVVVARFTTSGGLDTSGFGNPNGYVLTPAGTTATALDILIQPTDQRIVVTGSSDTNALAIRYNTDGSLDTTWNSTGIVTTPTGSSSFICGGIGALGAYGYLFNSNFNITLSLVSSTPIPFTTEGPLFNVTHSTLTNPEQITLPLAGTYLVTAVVDLTATGTGVSFQLQQNGSVVPGTSFDFSNTGSETIQAIIAVNSGDVIELVQTGLVSLSIIGTATITLEKIA